jgi:hypothetical protein
MKKSLLAAFVHSLVIFSAAAAFAASPTAELQVQSQWTGGFTANIRVTTPAALAGWELAFDLNRPVTSSWNAVPASSSGSRWTFRNESWNGSVPAGGSFTIGIQGSGEAAGAARSSVLLNGLTVSASTTAPPPASGGNPAASRIVLDADDSGEALQLVLLPGNSAHQIVTTGSFSVVSNNPSVATAAISGQTLTVTAKKPGRASLRISGGTDLVRVLGVRVNNPDGTPPGLPDYVAIGSVSEDSAADLAFWSDFQNPATNKRVDIRYIYLNGGASNSIGDGWNWRQLNDGQRATRFVEESLKLGMIPFFVWYNIPDSGESYYTDKQHIESKPYLEGYFRDLRHALEITRHTPGIDLHDIERHTQMLRHPTCVGQIVRCALFLPTRCDSAEYFHDDPPSTGPKRKRTTNLCSDTRTVSKTIAANVSVTLRNC